MAINPDLPFYILQNSSNWVPRLTHNKNQVNHLRKPVHPYGWGFLLLLNFHQQNNKNYENKKSIRKNQPHY